MGQIRAPFGPGSGGEHPSEVALTVGKGEPRTPRQGVLLFSLHEGLRQGLELGRWTPRPTRLTQMHPLHGRLGVRQTILFLSGLLTRILLKFICRDDDVDFASSVGWSGSAIRPIPLLLVPIHAKIAKFRGDLG
jgi:hypothetical protein